MRQLTGTLVQNSSKWKHSVAYNPDFLPGQEYQQALDKARLHIAIG
jgi:hypothetical protein